MAADAADVKAHAEAQIAPMLDQLEAQLQRHGGPWFLGEHYTAVDPLVFMLCRWTRLQARPAKARPTLAAYLQRVLERPATQRVVAKEQ
ncbi:glutathione S-transferase family protein, partial [Acinetobacter baumannii]